MQCNSNIITLALQLYTCEMMHHFGRQACY